jgi:putative two-component system response regulator
MKIETNILIADDEPVSRMILEEMLSQHYSVHAVSNGREAIDYLSTAPKVDLILLDVVMPEINGFEACRWIKSESRFKEIPVLILTSLEGDSQEELGLSLGAEDFIHKPFSSLVVLARVRNHLELALARRRLRDRNQELEILVAERTRDLLNEKRQVIAVQGVTITALCTLAEMRDNETGNHIRRTQNYIKVLAEQLRDHSRFNTELNDETSQLLFKSAPLDDIGKVGIPDAILQKPGKLTADEWEIMKCHPELGRNALAQAEREFGESVSFLRYAQDIAYCHHEKWDGTGYPQGLAGDAIPLSARLMAVADVYDALISQRVYKRAFSHTQAMSLIQEGRGKHFDPDITDALLDTEDQFFNIAQSFRDEPM